MNCGSGGNLHASFLYVPKKRSILPHVCGLLGLATMCLISLVASSVVNLLWMCSLFVCLVGCL